MPEVNPAVLVEVGVFVAGLALWLLAFAGALVLTRPTSIAPVPPTQDFGGPESPAVVSLITNRWELTEDAAESTLIDLAARRILEFRQPGNDPLQTTVHVRNAAPSGLSPYESMIFERVNGLAVGGVVPLTALTFRDEADAKSWTKRLNAAVVADARSRGLSQRRFSSTMVTALGILAAIPAFAAGLGVALNVKRTGDGDLGAAIAPIVIVWGVLGAFAGRSRGERDTPAGRAVAARWLGLKAYLRAQESFADLPPAAVTVWDRYLSYGDAVGATRVCSAVIDLGMGNRKRVWSSFGGTWHRVRVRYPGLFRRYGQKAVPLVLKALAALAFAFLVVRYDSVAFEMAPSSVTGWLTLAVRVLVLWPLGYGGYTLLATIVDLATPVTVTGEVLWVQVWRSNSGGEDAPPVPWLHYLAVDDGRDDRTVAWACPSDLAGRTTAGDVVTLTARRWTRRVLTLTVDQSSRSRALAVSGSDADADTEQIILRAMGSGTGRSAQALASAVHVPQVAPSRLVSAEEVGRVLGVPVTLRGAGRDAAVGPVAMAVFQPAGVADRALVATVVTGDSAELAIRTHRGGLPLRELATLSDEAYASGRWAVARRGAVVLGLEQHGSAPVNQAHLVWLLGQALSRLPAAL